MSLPIFSAQSELFSTAALSGRLWPEDDRYRLFGKLIYPHLAAARPTLEKCYCADNSRQAIEPVLLLGVSLLQELDGMPDRQAVEMLRYHLGWNFALNRQVGDPLFHPTTLVNFRYRLQEHQQSALGFATILDALAAAGLISRQTRQRLDSIQMFGRVARMSRLDCVREALRLALLELEKALPAQARPPFWERLWERYVESQADYRASAGTLWRKLAEAGVEAAQLLEWLRAAAHSSLASGTQVQLLLRVFGEQFQVMADAPAPLSQEKMAISPPTASGAPQPQESVADRVADEATASASTAVENHRAEPPPDQSLAPSQPSQPPAIEPKDDKQMDSARVQNPHEPEATYSVKGKGLQK